MKHLEGLLLSSFWATPATRAVSPSSSGENESGARFAIFQQELSIGGDGTDSQVQILGMSIVTLIFALLGFLSPAHRHRAGCRLAAPSFYMTRGCLRAGAACYSR